MIFICTLESLSDDTKLSKVILAFARSGYRVKSQRQEVSDDGKTLIHVEAESSTPKTREDLETELSAIEGCRLAELAINSSDAPAATATATATADVEEIDDSAFLKKIGENYPNIQPIVKTYAINLSSESRSAALIAIGAKVGGSIYSRDYSLGSPLSMPAALHRELTPALKEFSAVEATDSSITLGECPFCSEKEDETSSCDFLTGFIKGFMDKNPGTQNSKVRETNCGSGNSGSCSWEIVI